MFGLYPATPTRPGDYAVDRAGRALRNRRVRPRGLTPRRLAQLAGGHRRNPAVDRVEPRPWIDEPAIVVSDVIAGPHPWTGTLLDPSAPQPLPVGTLIRTASPERPPRHWLVWPDGRLRTPAGLEAADPQSVAAYLDEPAMAHFARELDARQVAAAEGAGEADAALADAVTLWIADLLRRRAGSGGRPRRAAPPRPPRAGSRRTRERELVCRWL